jgi:hypothetical protein
MRVPFDEVIWKVEWPIHSTVTDAAALAAAG